MAVSQDEEIQANAAKIVRICLRDDLNYDRITRENTGLGNLLLKNCATFTYSEVVLNELLAALKNFSKSAPKTAFIDKANVNVLVKLAKLPPSEKI
jgi:hypothetical protein